MQTYASKALGSLQQTAVEEKDSLVLRNWTC